MTEYKSLDQLQIKGRGIVYIVEYKGETIYKSKGNSLIGSKVKIDTDEFTIKGVESYAIETISDGQKIGLLV